MAVKGKGKQISGKALSSSPSSSGKRKSTHSGGECSVAPPKKKPSGVFRFVDDAAADADFEEEEEEDDLEWEVDEDFDFELPDIGAKEVKNATKGPGKSSPLPFFIKEEEMDDDELEEAIKERYRSSGFVSFDEDVKECDESLLVDHATKDLSVWRVKCMMGRERQAAFCLMQKFVDLLKIGKKLQIFSVFALDHVKGFFYVEADKACNVFEACNGLCILYSSKIERVPKNEAPNLLSIQKKVCGISKGIWVRMKNGKYKGDLAEVVFVNDAKKRVTIKLVPRIDLQAIAKKFGGGTSLKAAVIPAPRLISSHELEDFRPHIEVRRDRETEEIFEVLDGLMLKDGYLYKKVSMCSLIHWGVQPSSDELTKFEDLGKDDAKDVSWLSSIYKARMKKELPETSHQKNGEKSNHKGGEKSNQKDGDKQRNGYDIDDLVLFGRKGCGIIIDIENDAFKVLKGDVNGSEVVSIDVREIKKNCVDKVFTAADRCLKTISIDDVVKVFGGPLEGREGIVRHMYKGVLFIYDECQSENNGFFCAKSEMCDLVKKSRDFGGGKLSSSNAGPSFAQSPIRSFDQDENSQSFSRNRQSNSRGTFSVGQTLRICKGPLKGYLCRVIRIYRSDITVKLDSLGKLLTVDEKLLSFSNCKRDDASASDMLESKEEQSTGGLGLDNFEFNAGMTSFGGDSWNTPSISSFSFPRENDSKDQNQGADPWGSKLSSWNGDQEQGATNSWGKAPSSSAGQSSSSKMESGEKGADANCKNDTDAWNKASTKEGTSTGSWKNDTHVQKTDQTWSTKGASNGWGSAVHSAVEDTSDAGGWGEGQTSDRQEGAANSWGKAPNSSAEPSSWNKMESGEKGADADCKNDADAWNKASTKEVTSTGGWKNDTPVQKTDQPWSTKGEDGWDREASKPHTVSNAGTSGWERTKLPSSDAGVATVDWNKEASGKDGADGFGGQWGNSASPKKSGGGDLDAWGIKGKGLIKNNDDGWGKSAASQEIKPVDNNPWQNSSTSSVENQAAEDGNQSNSWSKVKSPPSSSGWEKSKATVTETVGNWKSTTDGNQAPGWGAPLIPSATPPIENESQMSSWDKANEGWNKEKSSEREQASGWSKAGNAGVKDVLSDSWDKAKGSDGHSFGQESRRQWKGGDDWRNDSDSGRGSGWSQGNSSNENVKSWGGDNSWNQQRDFDGGRGGSSRGRGRDNIWNQQRDFDGGRGGWSRGRGRYGGRGGRNEDNFEKPSGSDGGWRFGRGRGRNGAGGYNRDNSDTREFGRGRGRGRGQGRGPDQGQFQSSDWRNGQERFDGGFSNKPSSSWGSTQCSDWGKSRDQNPTGVTEEKVGWNSGNSNGGDNQPGWRTVHQNSGGSNDDMKEIDKWSKETRNNENWNSPKTFENKLSSWNETSNEAAKDTNSSQSGENGKKVDTLTENNWGKLKEPCSGSTAGNLGSSNGWGDSSAWDLKKEPNSSQGNWGGKDFSSGNQSSDWNNGGANKWSEQSGGHGKSESWNRPSDFGRGGGRGRDNSFSRGRGRGRDSGGRHSWNSSNESDKEGNDGGRAFNSNQEFKTGGSWNSGGNAEKGSWGSWKSGEENQPTDQANKQISGWAASIDKVEISSADGARNPGSSKGWCDNNNSASAWDSKKEPTSGQDTWGGNDSSGSQDKSGSWSRGSDFGRGRGRGRDNSFSSRSRGQGRSFGGRDGGGYGKEGNDGWKSFNSNKEFKTGGSWNSGGNAEKGSWGSWRSEGENQPLGRAEPQSEADGSKSSWDSSKNLTVADVGATNKMKISDSTDRGEWKSDPCGSTNASKSAAESWDTRNTLPNDDVNLKSWNEKGSGWGSEAGGSLPAQAQASKWQSGPNVSDGRDGSNSGNGGRNSGW